MTASETDGNMTEDTSTPTIALGELGAAGREAIAELGGEFSGAATKFVEERKASAVEAISAVASALHTAADELGDKSPSIAKFAGRSAAAMDGVSKQLAGGRWGEFVAGAGRLSEERPAVFMMICAGVGMAAGALLMGRRHEARAEDAPVKARSPRKKQPTGGHDE